MPSNTDSNEVQFKLHGGGLINITTPIPSTTVTALDLTGRPSDELFTAVAAANASNELFTMTSLAAQPGLLTLTKRHPDGTVAWSIPKMVSLATGANTYPQKVGDSYAFLNNMTNYNSKGVDYLAPTADGGVVVCITGFSDWDVIEPDYVWYSADGTSAQVKSSIDNQRNWACVVKYSADGIFAGWTIVHDGSDPYSCSGLVEGSGGDIYYAPNSGPGVFKDAAGTIYTSNVWDCPPKTYLSDEGSGQFNVLRFSKDGEFINRVALVSTMSYWNNMWANGLITAAQDKIIWSTRDDYSLNSSYYSQDTTHIYKPINNMDGMSLQDVIASQNLHDMEFTNMDVNRTVVASLNSDLSLNWAGSVHIKTSSNDMYDGDQYFVTCCGAAHTVMHLNGDVSLFLQTYHSDNIKYIDPAGAKTPLQIPANMTSTLVSLVIRLNGSTGAFIHATFLNGAIQALTTSEKFIGADASGTVHVVYNDADNNNAVTVVKLSHLDGLPSIVATGSEPIISEFDGNETSDAWPDTRAQFGFVHGCRLAARLLEPITMTDATAVISMPHGLSVENLTTVPATSFTIEHDVLSVKAFTCDTAFVATKDIKNNAVTTAKVEDGAITSAKLAPGTLTINGDIVPKTANIGSLGFPNKQFMMCNSRIVSANMLKLNPLDSTQRSISIAVPHGFPYPNDTTFPLETFTTRHELIQSFLKRTDDIKGFKNVSSFPLRITIKGDFMWTSMSGDDTGALWQVFVNGSPASDIMAHKNVTPTITVPENGVVSIKSKADRGAWYSFNWTGFEIIYYSNFIVSVEIDTLPTSSVTTATISDRAITNEKIANEAITWNKLADGLLVKTHTYYALPGAWGAASALKFYSKPSTYHIQSNGTFTITKSGMYQLTLTQWNTSNDSALAWRVNLIKGNVGGTTTTVPCNGTGALSLTLEMAEGDSFSIINPSTDTNAQLLSMASLHVTFLSALATPTFLMSSNNLSSITAAMYGFQLYNSAYSGPVISVRRSSDDAILDFYGNNIGLPLMSSTNETLLTWLGGSTGYVTQWYDQSGRGKHLVGYHATQPVLVDVDGDIGVYTSGNNKLEGPNMFDTGTVSDMHFVLVMKEVQRGGQNTTVSFNASNIDDRCSMHAPYDDGGYYVDLGPTTNSVNNRAQGFPGISTGTKVTMSAFKSSAMGKNGFRLNGGERYLSPQSSPANVSGGLVLNRNSANHVFYALAVFTQSLADLPVETALEAAL